MQLDELIERIEAGTYDPQVSGDVIEFYCLEEDYGVNPEPRAAASAAETGSKNPTYGTVLADEERAFADETTVRRAMGAGWLLPNPVPTAIREYEGELVPRTSVRFDHVTNYRKRHGFDGRFGVDPGRDVWEVNTRWAIDVPDGYSVLYAHPFSYSRETFATIPGIVDADRFPFWFRVPIEVHARRGNLQFGEPLAQVVPFERAATPIEAVVDAFEDVEAADAFEDVEVADASDDDPAANTAAGGAGS